MQKLLQLKTGALFVKKGGYVVYITNEQMTKTSLYFNEKTTQHDELPDADAVKLLRMPALERELSGAFSELFENPYSKPAKKAAAVASTVEDKNAPVGAIALADRDPATLSPAEKAALTRANKKAAVEKTKE